MIPEHPRQLIVKNTLLRTLYQEDFASIRPYLQPVVLKKRDLLQELKRPVKNIYFIETGLASSMARTSENTIETATVGRHGVVGAAYALDARISMHQSIMLTAGSALRIGADDLHRVMIEHPLIRENLLHYVSALIVESSQRTLCAAHHGLEQRLACWLSVACDNLDGAVLPVTHEHLSVILGVRRAGITESLLGFERGGLIIKSRGVIRIRERQILKENACSCYEIITSAYRENEVVQKSGQIKRRFDRGDISDGFDCRGPR